VPTTGEYVVNGQVVSWLPARELASFRNETFGFIFQFFGLISEYTAVENVMLPLLYRGIPSATARRKAEAVLELLRISELSSKHPTALSGGQQQRVAIARALVGQPEVILADEPTGSLDSAAGMEVLNLLEQHQQQGGTVVIVTHSHSISDRCRREIRIRDGVLSELPKGGG
jgi:putative ABC transport system ATP-binding protein